MDTTDPRLQSFVYVGEDHQFPIQNLPYGVFYRKNTDEFPRIGVAIGDFVLDLALLEENGLFEGTSVHGSNVFHSSSLNEFMGLGKDAWKSTRERISELLQDKPGPLRDNPKLSKLALIPSEEVELILPVEIGDYTDFYASRYHAFNVGTMFRGAENALMPNWLHLPVGYHGRASSIVVSGVDIHRPKGQILPASQTSPILDQSQKLDYEFEMGFFVGPGNKLGEPIPVNSASEHIFGLVIVNDWSARDIQGWEYRPLGPFLAKNFATSISPWVVPLEALEPFSVEMDEQDPVPLEYLRENTHQTFNIVLETYIQTKDMDYPDLVMTSNFSNLYWSMEQMIAHHSVTGCNMRTGDLLASGTISGESKESRACLLEATWNGKEPLELSNGETRKFLEDGDTVIMKAYCQGEGYRIGFGEVRSTIMPAHS